jgi:hypothetical protein
VVAEVPAGVTVIAMVAVKTLRRKLLLIYQSTRLQLLPHLSRIHAVVWFEI